MPGGVRGSGGDPAAYSIPEIASNAYILCRKGGKQSAKLIVLDVNM